MEGQYMKLHEITTIPRGDYNPKEREFKLWPETSFDYKQIMKPLPGGSGLTYVASSRDHTRSIVILDPQDLKYYVGALTLERARTIPEKTWQSVLINVHPKYRGRGIAKSLYRLALLPKPEGLGLTLVSDSIQTPGGARIWLSLSQISGVEITGLVGIRKYEGKGSEQSTEIQNRYDELMNDLLGEVGGVYHSENIDFYFYEIPVKVMGSKLENMIKKSLIKIYPKDMVIGSHTLLMAKYGGGV
jgi:GNAT superfamily N-acetyltransferase